MAFDPSTLASPTGAALAVYRRRAEPPARGVVQVNHGLAEHAARYARFAAFLGARGYHVYAHDHRGHGATSAADAPARMFAASGGVDKVIADVHAVQDHVARQHPGLPLIVFGHSMGGLIALDAALVRSSHLAGVAVWNANFSAGVAGRAARAVLAWERFRLGSDVPSRLLPRLTFGAWASKIRDAKTLFDWLSHDEAEVAAYIADPLCGWDASVSMWRDVFDLVFRGADDRSFSNLRRDLPFHLVGGADDPSTGGGRTVTALANRLGRMGFSNLASTVYPQDRHESLNELNRDATMRDFAVWADEIVRR